jgi:maltooligosyltrehalose trehalohydrolase
LSSRSISTQIPPERYLPVGAELTGSGVSFRVWAPYKKRVEVQISDQSGKAVNYQLLSEANGYWSANVPEAVEGMLYQYRVDNSEMLLPDPASRFQPYGPHGPSQIVNPYSFGWTDSEWRGLELRGQVIYEMHIGTYTPEGSWEAATQQLPVLYDLGITVLEIMPVADFPGDFGWGYDGVNLFAPTRLYGRPDDFRRFVDMAHSLGMAVILDVVYNHFGPDGNYLSQFSSSYMSRTTDTEWGQAVNYCGDGSDGVREFVTSNAAYWIREYHLDGFRLDATQSIYDRSSDHILSEVTSRARKEAAERRIIVIAEDWEQDVTHIRPRERNGYGMDGMWNDDFHHTAVVSLTGKRDGYYVNYNGTAQEFISAMKWGFLYQGQLYRTHNKGRGTPTFGIEPEAFITFLHNHDQIANMGTGERLYKQTCMEKLRALIGLMLLGPGTPMLFQGEEFCASSPFPFFADHKGGLAENVERGRNEHLSQFKDLDLKTVPPVCDSATFLKSKLKLSERETNREVYRLYKDLIRLRKSDPVISLQSYGGLDGAVVGKESFVIRFFGNNRDDRLLIVNLSSEFDLSEIAEPLLAAYTNWELIWSSYDKEYGGRGRPDTNLRNQFRIPSDSALLFRTSTSETGRRTIT